MATRPTRLTPRATRRVTPRASSRAAPRQAAPRAQRPDGNLTRLHILDTAGQVFAELGYANTTSKEICSRAGTNIAAVNYHFGGKDGLYEAVLIEAHQQIVSLDELVDLAGLPTDPRLKLRTLLTHLLEMGARPPAPWGFKVMLREAMSPSPLAPALIKRAIEPKAKVLLGLIAEIVGLPANHPAVQGGLMFTVLPCIVLLIAPRELGNKVLPALKEPAALIDELLRYVNGGLDAIAKAHRPRR